MAETYEKIRTDIEINAKAAITQLRQMAGAATNNHEIIAKFSSFLASKSREWGVPIKKLLNDFRMLNAEMSRQHKQTIFGNTGGKDIFASSEGFLKSAQAAGRFTTDTNGVVTALRNAKGQLDVTAPSVQKTGGAMNNAAKAATGFGHKIDVVRTALGTLVAVGIFQVIQAISSAFKGMLKGLVEIESAMFNIVNAEQKLSQQGVEISVPGLQQLIDDLKELNPMLSEFQATELISTLATKVAPAFGFGTKEIERMAKSVTVLAIRNQALGKSFEETQQLIITGLLSGKVTQGINQLGLKLTDQIVKEEAINLGLAKSAEAYDKLNAKAQERINILSILSILEAETALEAENIPAFLQSASGMIGVAKAEFQDLLTTLGQKFAPVLKELLRGIIQFLERANQHIIENEDSFESFITVLTLLSRFVSVLINGFFDLSLAIGKVGAKIAEVAGKLPIFGSVVRMLFPDVAYADTPTGPLSPESGGTGGTGEEVETEQQKLQDKLTDIMKEAHDKRIDLERDYQEKLADIAKDNAEKLADIARDAARKRADADLAYARKVEDINRDINQRIAEAQEDARRAEIDREEEFQNRLRELRDRFLFDLEDALRTRDARQVLRLIRQYNLDKKNLEERRKLEGEEAQESLARKIEELERQRKEKLEAARRELEEKQAEIDLWQQRETADARTHMQRQLADARQWHQRQLQEQREYLKRKLADLAEAIAKEYAMTAAGAQAISNLLNAGGTGGSVTQPGGGLGQSFADLWADFTSGMGYGLAEGGTFIATRPTKLMVGEGGPESVSVRPIGKMGADVSKVFSDAGLSQNNSLSLRVVLSDGLVAEIVESSLDSVSAHIEQVRREK